MSTSGVAWKASTVCFCDKHVHSCSSPPARSGVQQLGCCRTDHLSEAFELFRVGKVPELQRTGDCAELGCGDVLEEGAVEADHVLGTWRSVELERAPDGYITGTFGGIAIASRVSTSRTMPGVVVQARM